MRAVIAVIHRLVSPVRVITVMGRDGEVFSGRPFHPHIGIIMFIVHPVRHTGEGLAVKILGPCVLEAGEETQVLLWGIAPRKKPRMKIGLKDGDPPPLTAAWDAGVETLNLFNEYPRSNNHSSIG